MKIYQIKKMFLFLVLCLILSSASDLGIIPSLKDHYEAKPVLYDLNTIPSEQITKNIFRKFVMGAQSTTIRWELKKIGTTLPVHFHINEQTNFVEQGSLEVHSQGEKYILSKGQIMIFPANVPHEFVALEDDTVFIDIQTPTRQDFVNGDFDKAAKKVFNTIDK
jgi:quercetin dioxygenase-like cupin family protein